MKKITLLALIFLNLSFISCSNDNDDNANNAIVAFGTPLSNGNYWTYNVQNQGVTTRDSLYISNDTLINNLTFKKFKVKNNFASGFYSSSLRNNAVRKLNNQLRLSGNLSLATNQNLPLNVDLTLSDFVIFDAAATNDQLLGEFVGTPISQTVSNIPLTINYKLQSFGGETLPTFTSPNGTIYTNVKTTKIKLNASITTTITVFGIQQTLPALDPQDVLVSTLYFADGIGVVYSNTVTSYTLNSAVAGQLQIPATNTQTQKEFLHTYQVN